MAAMVEVAMVEEVFKLMTLTDVTPINVTWFWINVKDMISDKSRDNYLLVY